ncbi:MAG: hypothetical protein Q7T56_06750 [Nocardioidaceae bacterium]|nr:hypothetical protein [Nocardioidaceae bacterium]
MSETRPRVLYVTDLAYQARGRRYCDEDIVLTSRLRHRFDLATCHPDDAAALMSSFDVVVVRNMGPVIHRQAAHADFCARAVAAGARVYNELTGRADMRGKQYLLDLFAQDFPVIPTIERLDDVDRLPAVHSYVAKPELGADSVGLQVVSRDDLAGLDWDGLLVQPRIDFLHEVSFFYVDDAFVHALYAPDPERRWELVPYEPDEDDLAFARRFIDWNTITHGIQRVDACRTRGGDLLLVELEDLNPYLSLDRLPAEAQETFVEAFAAAISRLAATTGR